MDRYWIGDSRFIPLQVKYERDGQTDEEKNYYVVSEFATQSWLETAAYSALEELKPFNSNIIINVGLQDCIESCLFSSFNIENKVDEYVSLLNTLKTNYANSNVYFCTVGPVRGAYETSAGIISATALNNKIKSFNQAMQANCPVILIDCYEFLEQSNYKTIDGFHYSASTSKNLEEFIINNLKEGGSFYFNPRATTDREVKGNNQDETERWWRHTSLEKGLNPFPVNPQKDGKPAYYRYNGDTLPNCTAYAWGRFYEITGEAAGAPKTARENAEYWFCGGSGNFKTLNGVSDRAARVEAMATKGTEKDGYKRGQTPALGAVLCWEGVGGEAGHVAIVEQINPDGSIITSESGYGSASYWWVTTRSNSNGNWGAGSSYIFQGFIYCPLPELEACDKSNICTKNSYGITKEEMKPNAAYIARYFLQKGLEGGKGWTLESIAALLGNLQQESKMSPCVWESIVHGSTIHADGTQSINMTALQEYYDKRVRNGKSGRYPGYGLVQWTPYTKYTDWAKSNGLDYWDIDSQLERINYEVEQKIQWIAKPSKGYDMSFDDFRTNSKNMTAYDLAGAFAFCYERPASSTGTAAEQAALKKSRGEYADFWYEYLQGIGGIFSAANDDGLRACCFNIDYVKATEADFSFFAKNAEKAVFTLKDSKNKKITKNINLKDSEDGKIISFTISDLEPNTEYVGEFIVSKDETEEISETVEFKTEDDLPENPASVVFDVDLSNLAKSSLEVKKSADLGYFASTCGYDLTLFVNGSEYKTKEVNSTDTIKNTSFDFQTYFKYNVKISDIIQIGARSWTKRSSNKLYNKHGYTMSKPITFLTKSVTPYVTVLD